MVEMCGGKPVVFVSYGRNDATEFVDRLQAALASHGFETWRDTGRIPIGSRWEDVLADAIGTCDAVIAVLTPHAVRRQTGTGGIDGVCLDELSYARFGPSPKPIVPVKILDCQIPFSIFRLSYVDMREWRRSSDEFGRGVEKVVQGLMAGLRHEPPKLREPDNPNVPDQGSYLYDKRAGFTGREWLFDRVNAWLGAARSESALLITGEPGIGKSAFIAELAHRNMDGRVVAYHFCTREDRSTLEPGVFVMNLAWMLASRLPSFAPVWDEGELKDALREARSYPGQALDKAIVAPLSRLPAPPDGTRLILLDALDEAMLVAPGSEATDDGNIVSLIASRLDRLPSWLRVIATARAERRTLQELAVLQADVIDAQSKENVHDLARYVGARVRTGLPAADPANATHNIVRAADGNFLYAKSLLREVERDPASMDSLDSLPAGMSGFYGRQFRRLIAATSETVARPVLEVLVAALAPLTRTVITAAAATESYETAAVLNKLAEFVKDRDGGLVLFHRSLADWLTDPQSPFFADPHRGHERLAAEYMAAMDAGPQSKGPSADTAAIAYRAQYGLNHLAQAGVAASSSWDPWIFAATVLNAGEPGHALGVETEFVPVFAQQYVAAALSARNLTKITDLVVLIGKAAWTRYHDAGVLRIHVAADGAWVSEILGDAHDRHAVSQALFLSAWAGGITSAAVTAHPDRTQELGQALRTIGGLGHLARGLYIAGWTSRFKHSSVEERGYTLGRELIALARADVPWQPEEDERLREFSGGNLIPASWDLGRSPADVRRRAVQLGLTMAPEKSGF